jgi:hypothetical protein
MSPSQTKHMAEAVLRELPSVVGVCVHEDVAGHPREVHLLVRSGPDVRDLARDVRSLLEERLGIAIDQRVISIAQFSEAPAPAVPRLENGAATAHRDPAPPPPEAAPATHPDRKPAVETNGLRGEEAPSQPSQEEHGAGRIQYDGLETRYAGAHVFARVTLVRGSRNYTGEADEVDAGQGRARAGAGAMIRALDRACDGAPHLRLEAASVGRAFERDYAVVSVVVPAVGPARRPVRLAGAHQVSDGDVVTASALAVLKATNRLVELGFLEMPAAPS